MQETPVHLLVVDDRRENLLAVEGVLDSPELVIISVTSGEEALAQLSRHDFALILLDVRMPGMDGFETARRIRAGARGARTPIVFITAEDDLETEGYAAGAIDYLRKPFEPATLRAKVAAFVEIWKHALESRTEAARAQATSILESITDAFYALDHEWRFTYVNNQCERYFGMPREELLGQVLWDRFPMSRGTRFEQEYRRAVTENASVHFEEVAPLAGRWVEVTAYPSSAGISVYFRDITERKQIEAELAEQRRLLQFLVGLNDATRFVADPSEIMSIVAQSLGKYLGASRCAYAEIEADQNHFTVEGDYTRGCASIVGRHRLETFGPQAVAELRAGQTHVLHDVVREAEPGQDLSAYQATDIGAIICVPLLKNGWLVGGMAVHQSTPRAWTPSEITLVEMVAERSWSLIERARGAKQLAESEARFRQLADAMPQIVWTARPDGYLDYYNERWYAFTGFERGQGGDESWAPLLHPDDVQRTLDTWYEAVRTGGLYEIQYRFYDRKSEEFRWYLGRALPARNAAGEIVRWYGTCTDIDEQRRLFEALQESEERSRNEARTIETVNRIGTLLAAELDLNRLLQRLTDEATTLVRAQFGSFFYNVTNERGESYMLYTLSGVPREAFADFPMPGNTAVFAPTFHGAGIVRYDDVTKAPVYGRNPPYHGMPKGHLPVRSYLAVPVVSRSGEVLGGLFFGHAEVGVFTEQHERLLRGVASTASVAIDNARLFQQAEQRALELASANRRKDEFLAMLAHELRNPLAPIITSAQVLRAHADGDPVTQRHRTVIERQVRNMARLIDDLLDTSRLQHGKVTLDRKRIDLGEVVLHALEAARPLLEERRHSVSYSPGLGDTRVAGDALRLEQVFSNLLTNAAKYTEPGGDIRIRLEQTDTEAVFSVQDSGGGISAELLPYIFDAFTQGERGLDRSQGGLGVGLTMAKSLVELHEGTVEAQSEGPGRGSTFTVRLPLSNDERGTMSDESEPPSSGVAAGDQGSGIHRSSFIVHRSEGSDIHRSSFIAHRSKRVLVVDDNVDAADTLAELAALWGYEVQTVYNGADALKLAATYLPDVALVDIGMPGMDGFEVARRLREIPSLAGMQVVAVTGYGREEDRRTCSEVGFDHHLVKPVDPEELQRLLAPTANA